MDISCFSLYPGKNLGVYGDAGIITTNNKSIFKKLKFRNLGSDKKFTHDQIGFNSRLDTMQAAILLRKFHFLNINNKKRIQIAKYYSKYINNKKITKLTYSSGSVYHQYLILVKKKLIINLLKKNNILIIFIIQKLYINLKLLKILKMRSTKTQKELPVKYKYSYKS